MQPADPNKRDDVAQDLELASFILDDQPAEDPTRAQLSEAERVFRHADWQDLRTRIRHILARSGTSPKVLDRFDACGSFARVYWNTADQAYTVRASYCKSRHCRPCMEAKANKMARNLRRQMSARPRGRYRFTTLTLVHTDRPLADQLRHLMTSYARLRKRKLWRSQTGGAYFLEVKIGRDGRWHPHLHLITEGYFLPARELSREWNEITGDSDVVDVRGIPDQERVSFEVTKYVAKGTSRDVWDDDDRAIEWVCASRGVRTCGTFGTWRKFKVTETPRDDGELVFIDTLTNLKQRADAGDVDAHHILLCLWSARPPPMPVDSTVSHSIQSRA